MKKIKNIDIAENKIKKDQFICLNMEKHNGKFFTDKKGNELENKYWYYNNFKQFYFRGNKNYSWEKFGFSYNLICRILEENKLDTAYVNIISYLKEREWIIKKRMMIYYLEIYDLNGKLIYKGGIPINKIPKYLRKSYKDLIENKITFKEFSSLKNRLLYMVQNLYFKLFKI